MVLPVNCLLLKREDLSSEAQKPCKGPSMVACISNPRVEEGEGKSLGFTGHPVSLANQ